MEEVTAAAVLVAHASRINDAGLKGQLEHLAHSIVERRGSEIKGYLAEG